ncbi:hypothetical protein [Psychrilyobacter sp.]
MTLMEYINREERGYLLPFMGANGPNYGEENYGRDICFSRRAADAGKEDG